MTQELPARPADRGEPGSLTRSGVSREPCAIRTARRAPEGSSLPSRSRPAAGSPPGAPTCPRTTRTVRCPTSSPARRNPTPHAHDLHRAPHRQTGPDPEVGGPRRRTRTVHPRAGARSVPQAPVVRRHPLVRRRHVDPLRGHPRRGRLQPPAAPASGLRHRHRRQAGPGTPGTGRLPHGIHGHHPAASTSTSPRRPEAPASYEARRRLPSRAAGQGGTHPGRQPEQSGPRALGTGPHESGRFRRGADRPGAATDRASPAAAGHPHRTSTPPPGAARRRGRTPGSRAGGTPR